MTRRLTLAMLAVVLATLVVAGGATAAIGEIRSTRATEDRLAAQVRDLTDSVDALEDFFARVAAARARAVGESGGRPLSAALRSRLLEREGCPLRSLQRALRVRDAECVLVAPNGTVTGSAVSAAAGAGGTGAARDEGRTGGGAPAAGPERLDRTALAAGEVLSGSSRGVAWAAAALRPATGSVDRADRARSPVPSAAADGGADGADADLDADADLPAVLLVQDVSSELTPVRRWLLLAGLVALGLGAGVAWWLGRRLARPLVAAEQATARLAAGDLATRLPEPVGDDELGRLTRSINELAASLERSRGLEQQFLLSVSHDLRTPLTSIRGYAEALQDGTLGDVTAGAAVISQEAGRLERLVRDLLDLARLDARQFRLRQDRVDVASVASGTVDAFRPDALRAGVELVVAPPTPGAGRGARAWVTGDHDRLAQVSANLVENALKFAERRVEVSVDVDAAADRVQLAVSDDGPGIAAEDLPHVFERLYVAASQPRRRESGSGLGLAIVRELVGAHGGTVVAESPAGSVPGRGGTRIVVRLPRADDEASAAAAAAAPPSASKAPRPPQPPTAPATEEAGAPPGPGPDRPATPA